MSRNYLFENNKQPSNYEIIRNGQNDQQLLATKFNSQIYQIIHLLFGISNKKSTNKVNFDYYLLYNWNTTSNLLELNYQSHNWNCSVKCQMSASATFFLLQDYRYSYLYTLDQKYFIDQLFNSQKKNIVSILDQSSKIRKKSDINKGNYIFASGKSILAISSNNKTLVKNLFQIPPIYNFNPNNFVLDTKLYQNRLYILYRSIVTYNIYLYQFMQVQLLFQQYPKYTKLNETKIAIGQVFRFNNNYISQVIRFVRGLDSSTGLQVIWAYNDNQAYKCSNVPCLGYGYQIYNNIVFSSVASTNYMIAFYGKSNIICLKNFKSSLISQQIGLYTFPLKTYLTEMISYSNSSVNKFLVTLSDQVFPTVYQIIRDCKSVMAFQDSNFCRCRVPYTYNSSQRICVNLDEDSGSFILSTVYIAFIAICSILLLTLIFIVYKKIISLKRLRKSWRYNAAQNIIFQ